MSAQSFPSLTKISWGNCQKRNEARLILPVARHITNATKGLRRMIHRRKPTRKKSLARIASGVVLTVILLFAGLSFLGIRMIYSEQFGRFERPDPATTSQMHHSDLASLYPHELVSFYSGKNRLRGYLYHNPSSLGLIVVVHGLGGGADSYLAQIQYFLDQGWSILAYDATGSYESEGNGVGGFPQGIMDLDAALQFASSRADLRDLPILHGHSWGGYAVLTSYI